MNKGQKRSKGVNKDQAEGKGTEYASLVHTQNPLKSRVSKRSTFLALRYIHVFNQQTAVLSQLVHTHA